MDNEEKPDLLTSDEAAELLHVKKSWLQRDRTIGQESVPYIKLGRYVFYERRKLLAWLKSKSRSKPLK